MATPFQCTLVTPERQVLDEPTSYASLPAWDGLVGIMHLRAPMVLKLGDGLLRLDNAQGQAKWYFVGGGFAQVKDDKLTILANESVGADEVNRADAEASLKEAEARVARSDDEIARKARQIRRAHALIELASHK